jgi:hypothetical protein
MFTLFRGVSIAVDLENKGVDPAVAQSLPSRVTLNDQDAR